jgi:hypothetical protein
MKTQENYEDAGWDFDTVWEMTRPYTKGGVTETTLTFVTPFPYEIKTGDRYAVSAAPLKAHLWPLQIRDVSRMTRWNMVGVALKSYKLTGFDGNDNVYWRVSAFRNRSSDLETTEVYPDVSSNPPDSAGALNIDGIDVVPYVEQIACGVSFLLTGAEFNVSITDSRDASD